MKNSRVFLFYPFVKLGSCLKVSYILGSYAAFFSGANLMLPLAGRWFGLQGSLVVCGFSSAVHLFFGSFSPFIFLAHILPGFCASCAMAKNNLFIRVVLPISCMLLFIAHPVGLYATPYTFYWLIPIVFYFVKKQSLFTDALSATFIAHAVGSVCWLYAKPMTGAAWYTLIPLIAIERLCFAVGMVVICKIGEAYILQVRTSCFPQDERGGDPSSSLRYPSNFAKTSSYTQDERRAEVVRAGVGGD